MSKTATGLVNYAKAQVGKPYWFGCFGQTASASLYSSMKAQYPKYYTASDYASQYGQRVHDCSGLIKGYLYSTSVTATPVYNASQDVTAATMYSQASEKGKIATFPKENGMLVFKGTYASSISHVGVYCDDEYVYEAKGHAYGVVKTKFSASDWTFWAKHKDITYETTETTTVTTETTTESKSVIATKKADSLNEEYRGRYKVSNCVTLNVRNGAGKNYKILVTIPKDKEVLCYGYYSTSSETPWFYITFNYDDVEYVGFASSTYLTRSGDI